MAAKIEQDCSYQGEVPSVSILLAVNNKKKLLKQKEKKIKFREFLWNTSPSFDINTKWWDLHQ